MHSTNQLVTNHQSELHHLALLPEEVIDELLFGGALVVQGLDGYSSSIILVYRKVEQFFIITKDAFYPLGQLELCAQLHFHLLGTLEEDHVPAVLLGQRVPVKVLLGPVPGDAVAIRKSIHHLLKEARGGASWGVLQPGPESLHAVELHVDVSSSVQHLHLCQYTGQVSKLGLHAMLEVHEVSHQFHLIFLGCHVVLSL